MTIIIELEGWLKATPTRVLLQHIQLQLNRRFDAGFCLPAYHREIEINKQNVNVISNPATEPARQVQ